MSLKRRISRRGKPQPVGMQLYEVVYGAMPTESSEQLSPATRVRLPRLNALLADDPRSAAAELRALLEREPVAMLYNWLGGALRALGEVEEMDAVVRENYRRNPGYLFGRLNYAEICMRDGDLDGVREALGPKLDLRSLLPGRKRYHVAEVVGFYYAVALYRLETGDREAAETLYGILEEADPCHPATVALKKTLWPPLLDLSAR